MPTIKAFFRPCTLGGGPGGAWLYGEGAEEDGGTGAVQLLGTDGGGTVRGSAT